MAGDFRAKLSNTYGRSDRELSSEVGALDNVLGLAAKQRFIGETLSMLGDDNAGELNSEYGWENGSIQRGLSEGACVMRGPPSEKRGTCALESERLRPFKIPPPPR